MQMMMIDVLLQHFSNETVLVSRQKQHDGPLAGAPSDEDHHGKEQQRDREKQAIVIQIQRQRAKMLFPIVFSLENVVDVVEK